MTRKNTILIFIGQCLAHLSLEKFSLVVDGNIYRDQILDKIQNLRDPGTLIDKLNVAIKSFPKC